MECRTCSKSNGFRCSYNGRDVTYGTVVFSCPGYSPRFSGGGASASVGVDGCLGLIGIGVVIWLVAAVGAFFRAASENLHVTVPSLIGLVAVVFLYRRLREQKYLQAWLFVMPLGAVSATFAYIRFSLDLPPERKWTPSAPIMRVYEFLAAYLHLIVPGFILLMTLLSFGKLLWKRSFVKGCVLVAPLGLTLALSAYLGLVGAFARDSAWMPPPQAARACVWLVDNIRMAAPGLILLVTLTVMVELLVKGKPSPAWGAALPLGLFLAVLAHLYFAGALTQGGKWTPPPQIAQALARWNGQAAAQRRKADTPRAPRAAQVPKNAQSSRKSPAAQTSKTSQASKAFPEKTASDTGQAGREPLAALKPHQAPQTPQTARGPAETFAESMRLFNRGDHQAAFALFLELARQGHTEAQYWTALCYESGQGTPRDDTHKAEWLAKAARQNYAPAQYKLALCYRNGSGVKRDARLAFFWMKQAAERGFSFAQHDLGLMYAQGSGTAKDEGAAKAWLRKAARQGLPEARDQLLRLGGQP